MDRPFLKLIKGVQTTLVFEKLEKVDTSGYSGPAMSR